MRLLRALATTAMLLTAAVPAAAAPDVLRCPDGQAGRVVVVNEDLYVSLCASANLCGFVLGVVYGVEVRVNGSTLVHLCPDTGPTHVDPGTLYWLEQLDPFLCPILASAQPGVPGVFDIGPDGDLTVDGVPTWECPPYGF